MRPRAHHYLPVFYLKGFTSPDARAEGCLWAYEKGKPIRKSKPINEAHQRDFYSFVDEQGERRDLEQPLSQIESQFAPLFRAIESGYHDFHPEEWKCLAFFTALVWSRGPTGRDFVNQLSSRVRKAVVREQALKEKQFDADYEAFKINSGTKTDLSAEEMRKFILSDEWEVRQESDGYTLQKMFEGALVVSEILQAKHWEVLISEDQFFCTSDYPVLTLLPDKSGEATIGAGFETPGIQVYFPLNKRNCLVLRDRARCNGRMVPGKLVREINKFMMVGARRFIYCCEKNTAIEVLFNKIGCKSVPGHNAFMPSPNVSD